MRRLLPALTAAVIVSLAPLHAEAAPVAPAHVTTVARPPAPRPATAPRRYDGAAASRYAASHARNRDDAHRAYNPLYRRESDGDCTNFVSQSLVAGGLRASRGWTLYSHAWWSAPRLLQDLRARRFQVTTYSGRALAAARTSARPGDVYFYDWGTGEGVSHAAMAITDGPRMWFGSDGRKHTAGVGSRIAQHTVDRVDAPWDSGYVAQPHGVNPTRMKVYLVHMHA